MRQISKKTLSKLETIKKVCVWCKDSNNIEFHHALIYSGKQLDEPYSIHPLCVKCHRGYNGDIRKEIKNYCELLSIATGLQDLYKKYPKFDWLKRKKYLENLIKKYV